jgi:hypothetical protein
MVDTHKRKHSQGEDLSDAWQGFEIRHTLRSGGKLRLFLDGKGPFTSRAIAHGLRKMAEMVSQFDNSKKPAPSRRSTSWAKAMRALLASLPRSTQVADNW